jgi:hypothetical protein
MRLIATCLNEIKKKPNEFRISRKESVELVGII